MSKSFWPHIGLVRGASETRIISARWGRFGADIIKTKDWSLVQYGIKGRLPLNFILKVRKGKPSPKWIKSLGWKRSGGIGSVVVGTTRKPIETVSLFRPEKIKTNSPDNRRMLNGTTVRT